MKAAGAAGTTAAVEAAKITASPFEGAPALSPPISSFAPSASPAKRKKVASSKADLRYFNPSIRFRDFSTAEDTGIKLPSSVVELWKRCEDRNSFQLADPPVALTIDDKTLINLTLTRVLKQAKKWRDTAYPESHWVFVVVGPVLDLLQHIEAFQKPGMSDAKIAVLDVTTTQISPPDLVPYSETLFVDLVRRIDYVVGLDLSDGTLEIVNESQYATGYPSINQTTAFANDCPLFLNIEVKRHNADRDPAVQLAAWIAAEITKRLFEDWDINFPVFAIEIEGDRWTLYVAAARVKPTIFTDLDQMETEEATAMPGPSNPETESGRTLVPKQRLEIFFFGRLDIGSTMTRQDLDRLLHNLLDIVHWGQTDFQSWWRSNVEQNLRLRIAQGYRN